MKLNFSNPLALYLLFNKRDLQQAGYCFVEFPDQEAARRAMLHINGKVIPKSKPAAAFNLSFANSPNAPYVFLIAPSSLSVGYASALVCSYSFSTFSPVCSLHYEGVLWLI
uniref:RRM domain-containing protein n=1 Tax=Parascaris equorum TaxID=6256 RepID=A0A914SCF3_PAREQ